MQQVNGYYSLRYAADATDQDLMWLCRDCARQHAADVQWACSGHDQAECEFCGASNDEDYSRQQDELYAEITGRPAPARRRVA